MFLGLDLAVEDVPDATTLLEFQRQLETHGLTRRLMEEIGAHLQEQGLLLREGTLVDATIIGVPSSTKNREHARDPEIHQTKKGNPWHFGMKVHAGAEHGFGRLVHSAVVSAANDSDVEQHAADMLHGQEKRVYGGRLSGGEETPGSACVPGRGVLARRDAMARGAASAQARRHG